MTALELYKELEYRLKEGLISKNAEVCVELTHSDFPEHQLPIKLVYDYCDQLYLETPVDDITSTRGQEEVIPIS